MDWERERPLPQFLVIGAMKAGTTSLYYYLRRHPEIQVSDAKELDFFVREKNWSKGEEWYRRQFPRSFCRVRGEFSVNYSKASVFPGVPKRIAGLVPGVKIIYLLRDPYSRFVSQYQDHVLRGVERQPLEKRLSEKEGEYLRNSDYFFQLIPYLRHFDRKQILLVSAERLKAEKTPTLKKIYSFLGVSPRHSHRDDGINHNEFQTKWSPELLPDRRGRALIQSTMTGDTWARRTPARDALDRSVVRLAEAWPREAWIREDLRRR